MMKIVIASDSFKGSLSSREVAQAVGRGVASVLPEAVVAPLEVADGGEGTAAVITASLGGKKASARVTGPMGRPVTARYGVVTLDGEMTAVIDVAQACGITLVDPRERDVMLASSRGVGEVILNAFGRGCRRFMVGLGGSASCDAGMGMLAAMGVVISDDCGRSASAHDAVARVDLSMARHDLLGCRFDVLTDVEAPLYGPEGAAHLYAPQKGASPEQVIILDRRLRQWAAAVERATGGSVATLPGAGAAGGLGAAFAAFMKARPRSGAEAVLDLIGMDRALRGASVVITGEGSIDRQTLQGKLPMAVLKRARRAGVPCVALAGRVADREALLSAGFASVVEVTPAGMPLAQAMHPATAMNNVARATITALAPFSHREEG